MPNVSSVRPLRAVPALVLAILAASCGDNPNTPVNTNAPASLAVSAGNDQTGLPNAPLATPVADTVLVLQHLAAARDARVAGR